MLLLTRLSHSLPDKSSLFYWSNSRSQNWIYCLWMGAQDSAAFMQINLPQCNSRNGLVKVRNCTSESRCTIAHIRIHVVTSAQSHLRRCPQIILASLLTCNRWERYLGLLHCTMCGLCSMFSFQPNKLRHILEFIFVPACTYIRAIREWPEMAKFRDEPRKMTPTSGTENFFGVENLLVICPFDKESRFQSKNWCCPKYQNIGVKIALFRLQRPIGASPVNIFHTKQVSNRFPIMRVPKVLLLPLKIRNFGPKTAVWTLWRAGCISQVARHLYFMWLWLQIPSISW